MNVRIITRLRGEEWAFKDAEVTFDTTVLQVDHGAETTTFPLANVISFTTSESGPK